MSEIRKRKILKREKLTWAPPCAAQPAGRPSQQAAQPASLLCRLRPRQREGSVAGARAPPRHATCSPACLPLPSSSRCPGRRHALPCSLSLSLGSSPPLPRSLSHGRTPPSPPFAIAADTGHPSLPRLAQELRRDPLFLPTTPRLSGSPASPPTSPFPSSATGDHRRRFAALRPSPSPLTIPAAPR